MDADFWEVIHVYTRAQALTDGALKDVTEMAREAGFTLPCALTIAAWHDCVTWTRDDVYQDEPGRLWDVLWMAYVAARRHPDTDRLDFTLLRIPNEGRSDKAEVVKLRCHIGPGDTAEPVLTIGFPSDF